jgi:predicted nuclease of predicted toxin-antitoxin system
VTTCSQLWSSGRWRRVAVGCSARRGVKFLVDAQLPARFVADAGHDVAHTSELPEGNRTTDARIAEVADGEGRVVVTKDRDFRDGHLLSGSPRRLLIVATGNITNAALLALFEANLDAVVDALGEADFVELGPEAMVIHRRRGPR